MIRDNMNLCQCTFHSSQIPILVTAPPIRQWQSFIDFYHDAPNSHVPGTNFL